MCWRRFGCLFRELDKANRESAKASSHKTELTPPNTRNARPHQTELLA
jgi:hypothetical protein